MAAGWGLWVVVDLFAMAFAGSVVLGVLIYKVLTLRGEVDNLNDALRMVIAVRQDRSGTSENEDSSEGSLRTSEWAAPWSSARSLRS